MTRLASLLATTVLQASSHHIVSPTVDEDIGQAEQRYDGLESWPDSTDTNSRLSSRCKESEFISIRPSLQPSPSGKDAARAFDQQLRGLT